MSNKKKKRRSKITTDKTIFVVLGFSGVSVHSSSPLKNNFLSNYLPSDWLAVKNEKEKKVTAISLR